MHLCCDYIFVALFVGPFEVLVCLVRVPHVEDLDGLWVSVSIVVLYDMLLHS